MQGDAVRRWCGLAAEALGRTRAEIDALNVFPVPDADTGTNLHLTVVAAADALDELPAAADAARVWRALARGVLLGARGNSGVILSQVFRGLADVLGPREAPPDGAAFAAALEHASGLARGAVEHPVEGAILSVLAEAASACARVWTASGTRSSWWAATACGTSTSMWTTRGRPSRPAWRRDARTGSASPICTPAPASSRTRRAPAAR